MKNWKSSIVATAIVICGAIPALLSANLTFLDAWLSLWFVLFVIGFALIALEGAYFMRAPEIHRAAQFVVAFAATGVTAALAAAAVIPMRFEFTLATTVSEFFAERTASQWVVRWIGAAGLYTFLYGTIGSITWFFVRDFYQDPKHGLELRVPDGRVIIALQLFRGSITTLAILPLIAAASESLHWWWLRLALLLVVTMAIGPLMLATRWPVKLRLIHAIEISVFAVLFAFIVCWLMARPETSPSRADGEPNAIKLVQRESTEEFQHGFTSPKFDRILIE